MRQPDGGGAVQVPGSLRTQPEGPGALWDTTVHRLPLLQRHARTQEHQVSSELRLAHVLQVLLIGSTLLGITEAWVYAYNIFTFTNNSHANTNPPIDLYLQGYMSL